MVMVVAGKDVSIHEKDSADHLRKTIEEAQADPRVVRGKVIVIGFSLGGGGALALAASLKEAVAGVVAYDPNITNPGFDAPEAGASTAVPTLIPAGEKDNYRNCCLIESMRKFEAGAQAAGARFELVA
jgi:dienelactone hydrolase